MSLSKRNQDAAKRRPPPRDDRDDREPPIRTDAPDDPAPRRRDDADRRDDEDDDDRDRDRDAPDRAPLDADERYRRDQARTRQKQQEQSAELATLAGARPAYAGYIHDAPLNGVLLFGLSTDDSDPLAGVLRALRGDVSALVVLSGDQEQWGLLTPALEGLERRLEVSLELRRREMEAQRAK